MKIDQSSQCEIFEQKLFFHCVKHQNFTKVPGVKTEFLQSFWCFVQDSAENVCPPKNFYTRKIGEISVFCTVFVFLNRTHYS